MHLPFLHTGSTEKMLYLHFQTFTINFMHQFSTNSSTARSVYTLQRRGMLFLAIQTLVACGHDIKAPLVLEVPIKCYLRLAIIVKSLYQEKYLKNASQLYKRECERSSTAEQQAV